MLADRATFFFNLIMASPHSTTDCYPPSNFPCLRGETLHNSVIESIATSSLVSAREVFSTRWWMGSYKSLTPKRHVGYSNSKKISFLNMGTLRWDYTSDTYKKNRTTKQVVKGGKKTFTGVKKTLKASQRLADYSIIYHHSQLREYPYRFGLRVLRILPRLKADACKMPEPPCLDWSPVKCYKKWQFEDLWSDASLEEVFVYLRGNSNLEIPAEWKNEL